MFRRYYRLFFLEHAAQCSFVTPDGVKIGAVALGVGPLARTLAKMFPPGAVRGRLEKKPPLLAPSEVMPSVEARVLVLVEELSFPPGCLVATGRIPDSPNPFLARISLAWRWTRSLAKPGTSLSIPRLRAPSPITSARWMYTELQSVLRSSLTLLGDEV